jgi:tetratricopeptide (TPR) repeat protein
LPFRAINFLTHLGNHNFGKRPICFITHSLGGLVVKQLLHEAVNSPSDQNKSLAAAVRGVVFIATPHIGSQLAKLAYKLRYLTRPTSVIADLMPGIGLHRLNKWYRDYVAKTNVKTLVFSENKPTKGLVTVVDLISADAGIPDVTAINTDFDHIEICKPRDKKNIVYSTTVRFLDEVFGPREIFHIPYQKNKYFTDRDEIISQIRKNFEAGESMQSLTGIGGIGKTQTAVRYAHKFRDQYRAVLWARAQSRETLVSDFADAAVLLHLLEKNEPDQMLAFNAFREWLGRTNSWLLILDYSDDLAMAEEFTIGNRNGHVLITTLSHGVGKVTIPNEVPKWGLQEGALFLLRRLGKIHLEASMDEAPGNLRSQAEALSTLLDGLPLALDQAAAFIMEMQSTLAEYIELYHSEHRELLSKRGQISNGHPDSVAASFSMSFRQVRGINPATVDLLRLCAFLDADEIPEEIFQLGAEVLGESLGSVAVNQIRIIETIRDCGRFSLLRRNPEARTVSLHRLVQVFIKEEMGRESQRLWAERAVLAVNKTFPSLEFDNWPACERLIQHALTLAKHIKEHNLVIPDAGRLLNHAARYLKERARFAEALPLYQQSLAIYETALGPEHILVAAALNNLALCLQSMGKYMETEPLYKRALSIYERKLNPEDKEIAAALNNLAMLYRVQKKYSEAEPLYKRCIEIYEKALGPENPELATALSNLAELYDSLKEYGKSAPIHERSLILREKALGSGHPDIANTYNNLAVHYYSQGMYTEAEYHYNRALNVFEKALGPKHTKVATAQSNLAGLYKARGNFYKAEALYKLALGIFEKALGNEHPDVAETLKSLAIIYGLQGKHAKAESFNKRALAILEKAVGRQSGR